MLHTARSLLRDSDFVHVYSFDFSKAFDTVRHATLSSKLAQLELPDSIYNWAVDFLENHSHCTKYAGQVGPYQQSPSSRLASFTWMSTDVAIVPNGVETLPKISIA